MGFLIIFGRQVVTDHRAVVDGVKKAVSEAGGQLDMIMIVLSNNNAETYARVKKCCSIEYGSKFFKSYGCILFCLLM